MQSVILAGGKGTRMASLNSEMPKPMLEVLGKNLIQHKIDRMPEEIKEVIIIVSHKKERIMEFFGSEYGGKKITYADQGEPKGTGHALWRAKPHIKGPFISMMGDDIYSEKSIREIIRDEWGMTVFPAESFPGTLDIIADNRGCFEDAIPSTENGRQILLDICLYKFQPEIFNAELVKLGGKEEWGLPHTLFKFAKDTGTSIKVHAADWWQKANKPEDLQKAAEFLRE